MGVRHVRSKRAKLLVVCRACAKRTGGDKLAKPLRVLLKPLGYDVVASRCMGLCPRKATAMRDADRPGEWLVVEAGTTPEVVAADLATPQVMLEPPLLFRSMG